MRTVALLLAALVVDAAPPVARTAKTGLDQERVGRILPRMKEFVDRGELAGVVTLVARHGQVVHHEAVGLADIESNKPMRTDSIFQVMSMTKPVTGVAIMMLAEEGRLSINDPVEKHLPEFRGQKVAERAASWNISLRTPSRPITIRDLMTHTSGMPEPRGGLANLYQKLNVTLAHAVKVYSTEPLEFDPGTRWMYSNPGIATLGRIVEVVSGMPFEKFLANRIFVPLGMKDSFLFAPAEKTPRIATVYAMREGKLTPAGPSILGGDSREFRKGAIYSAPEFGMYSTASDIFAFVQMMLNNGTHNGKRLLSKASVDLMTSVHTGELRAGHLPGTGFGLTWEVVKDPIGNATLLSKGTFGHGGAFGTHMWADRDKDLVGVFLVQTSSTDAKNAFFQLASAAVTD